MDEYLWPARNVAEYAYCPRLFYLMEIEGIHIASADTEAGVATHKRVDRPSAAATAEVDPDRPRVLRSLTLTSKTLGLTATLDLAEISGNVAVPVEYRKGRPKFASLAPPPDDPGEAEEQPLAKAEPWPTDRVQVGLQSILLEEAGYKVDHAVLYYAAEKRRLEIPVDEALKAEALATLQAARTTATGSRPLPLVNDARCVRCSLQPICLPDEVNQQRDISADNSPRRIWPPRDDAIHAIAQQEGIKIGIKGMGLTVTDKEGAKVKEIPLANLESLAVVGAVQISTQAVGVLASRGIPVAYLSAAGRLVAMIDPLDSVSAEVRKAQVRRFDEPATMLALSRALVAAKITNQRTLLMRNATELPADVPESLNEEARRAVAAESIDAVRGHEGQAAAIYFAHAAKMFKGQAEAIAKRFDANGRARRPPPDPINSVLSFGYTMLTNECVAALRLARLEPSIGAFHVSRPGRPALALDLMEPFRPLIADSVAVAAFNRGELTEGHFSQTAAGCAMTDAGRKAFFNAYGRRMDTEVTHPIFEYRLSYRRMIMLHARMIAVWLLGEIPTLNFLTTR